MNNLLFISIYSIHIVNLDFCIIPRPTRHLCICTFNKHLDRVSDSREFNGSVNISESCGFRSQFEPLHLIF